MDYITVQLERDRAVRLLKLSISEYLEEIGILLNVNRENDPEIAKKVCLLAKTLSKEEALLESLNSANSDSEKERELPLDKKTISMAIGCLEQMRELLTAFSPSEIVDKDGHCSHAGEIVSLAEQLKDVLGS